MHSTVLVLRLSVAIQRGNGASILRTVPLIAAYKIFKIFFLGTVTYSVVFIVSISRRTMTIPVRAQAYPSRGILGPTIMAG